ncbi:uncharacterized protein LOC116107926 [Pistacia vera]|uniref:uncharacterized protein LOC116107926 n=1 Tax=Pistacia vera TaxID=55513 RepID=UPI001263B462|nr:uncharacterized protein LOC116107926 [Pistacia vera]
MDSVEDKKGTTFFVYKHDGIGKIFLWSTIISKLRSKGKIVLLVATSGIVALLLPEGRTTHSCFRIPLDITDKSTCDIKKGTQLADLIRKMSLIIWDEAPIANRYCFEALDRSLKDKDDQSNVEKMFGGMTVALGGDFRQILPVIPKGKKFDIMQASLCSSYLWENITVSKLTENMRLKKNDSSTADLDEMFAFDKWLLRIGKGTSVSEDESLLQILDDLNLTVDCTPQETILNVVFRGLCDQTENVEYIRERAILTAKNDVVHEFNEYIIQTLPSEGRHTTVRIQLAKQEECQMMMMSYIQLNS